MTGFYKENFIDEADAAASIPATRGIKVGGALGHIYAQAVAGKGGFSIAAGKKVTLTGSECETVDGTYAANGTVTARQFDQAAQFAEGEVIAEIYFASYAKNYGKVDYACDDAAATGAVKVIPAVMG